ncbi:MAG: HAD family hydrolase [Nitrospinae bacterium]|nr:HAD family hydrolase [Nitrospinota bacterium]
MRSPKALFLDRDGVINVDAGYVHAVEAFRFVEGVFDLTRTAIGLGYLPVVVTNQAGIGRGYYSERQFVELTEWMLGEFDRQGCPLAAVYYSPYHAEHGKGEYRRDTWCRKPNPGMLFDAKARFGLDLSASALVGDKASDMVAALRAGVGLSILIGSDDAPLPEGVAPVIVPTVLDAETILRSWACDNGKAP